MSATTKATPVTAGLEDVEHRPRFWRRLLARPGTVVALALITLLGAMALVPAVFAPYDPAAQDLTATLQGPSGAHWLGTDELGRDILSRIVHGARTAVVAALLATGIAVTLGVSAGLLAAYLGGWLDRVVTWVIDVLMSVPGLLVAFGIIAVLGPGLVSAMVAVGIVLSTRFARLTRGAVLAEREQLYIDAAHVTGIAPSRIMVRHLLPNVVTPLTVQASLTLGVVLILEAALSFVGVGAAPGTPSWGRMLSDAQLFVGTQPFLPVTPGIAISLAVLAFNVLGDGIRDALGQTTTVIRRPHIRVVAAGAPVEETGGLLNVAHLEVHARTPSGGAVQLLDDVTLRVEAGKVLGLVGESGSGKSMTALAITGLLPPAVAVTDGSVRLDGRQLMGLSESEMHRLRGSEVALIFQEPVAALDPSRRIVHQLADPLRTHLGLDRSASRRRAIELLAEVGVSDPARRVDDYPHQFSGGMAQRVMIARAIAAEPKLLIADEPTTALDVTIQAQTLELLRTLRDTHGMGIILITHDLGVAADLCDDVAVMYGGQVVEVGTAAQVLRHPRHPYTGALLDSVPRPQARAPRLTQIPGRVPPASAWPTGCRFHPRCAYAQSRCSAPAIELREVEDRAVRCVRAEELELTTDGPR
jgi:oligopeptide/dipeptide ABC transporter ATP-binding protein